MALAITPQGEFGDLRFVQGFKSRGETLTRTGPHSRLIICKPQATFFYTPGTNVV